MLARLGQNACVDAYVVERDDPRTADVRALLAQHLAFAQGNSRPEDVHALDLTGLLDRRVSFFSIRAEGELLGVGALQLLDASHAEIKSMHTALQARGRGVGRAMVGHLVDLARKKGCTRVSLETGSADAFAPARALYRSAGFEPCGPFAAYRPSPNSVWMTLDFERA